MGISEGVDTCLSVPAPPILLSLSLLKGWKDSCFVPLSWSSLSPYSSHPLSVILRDREDIDSPISSSPPSSLSSFPPRTPASFSPPLSPILSLCPHSPLLPLSHVFLLFPSPLLFALLHSPLYGSQHPPLTSAFSSSFSLCIWSMGSFCAPLGYHKKEKICIPLFMCSALLPPCPALSLAILGRRLAWPLTTAVKLCSRA